MIKYLLLLMLASSSVLKAQIPDQLIGRWEAEDGQFAETWEKVSENQLVGEGFFLAGKDTVAKEKLFLQKLGDHWVYIAIVNKNEPVLFTLVQQENNTWVFENKEHDYPQKVIYQFFGTSRLTAYTEGPAKDGKQKQEAYPMRKKE